MSDSRKQNNQKSPVRLHIKASVKSEHPMNINLMKCPKCGTIYHWGIRGWGNCPTCNKDSLPRKEKNEDGSYNDTQYDLERGKYR